MEIKSLVKYLEESKDNGIEKQKFIKAIYEARPDLMELERRTPKGYMYDITDKDNPSKAIDDFSEDSVKQEPNDKNKSPGKKSNPKEVEVADEIEDETQSEEFDSTEIPEESEKPDGDIKEDDMDGESDDNTNSKSLTIKSDIGFKRIAFDDSFKNITDENYQSISDVFTPDEVKMINSSKPTDWKELDRAMIMCRESDYKSGDRNKISCFNSSNATGQGRPKKFPRSYIDAFYKPYKAGTLKDAKERYIIFNVKNLNEMVNMLQLRSKKDRNRYAIKFEIPGEENPYLMVASDLHKNFLYKEVK